MSTNKPTVEEMNRVIADFMDWRHSTDPELDKYEMEHLKYHISWGWIMRVWVKFRSIGLDDPEYHDWCGALGWYLYCASTPTTFHERLYYAIKWHNEQKQNNETNIR